MNINDFCWVQLSSYGKSIAETSGYHTRNRDGWQKWQLWVLMSVFGPHMHAGMSETVFVNNEILFTDPEG